MEGMGDTTDRFAVSGIPRVVSVGECEKKELGEVRRLGGMLCSWEEDVGVACACQVAGCTFQDDIVPFGRVRHCDGQFVCYEMYVGGVQSAM